MLKQFGVNASKAAGFAKSMPPFVLEGCTYIPSKPVLLVLPSGRIIEFGTIETAATYLDSARRCGATGADETKLFVLESGRWLEPPEDSERHSVAS
jgi:hypothetical protein